MSGISIFPSAPLRASIILTSALVVSACQDGQVNLPFLDGFGANETSAEATQTTGPVEERDVEAPEVFSVTEQGLWDGRPSLGGVWVAHPDVAEPERVIIRNETTGDFVIGALFRRERDNPGPTLQVSSDAAEELGMLAGAPQTLSVVALRREAAPMTPPIAAPDPDFIAAETVAPGAPADVSQTELAPSGTPLEPPAGIDQPLGAPLDASTDPLTAAAAAIDAAEAAQTISTAPAAEAATAPIAPTATSGLSRPFIQIGIFSVEDNAAEAAAQMSSAGLPARVVAQESQGRAFWRVLVGPASNETARATALDQVTNLGFADAYFVAQ